MKTAKAPAGLVETRAGTIAVSSSGDGPPLLLLPAAGRAAADFEPVRARLAARHRTIALDWPAMGESPAPPDPDGMSAPLLADALEDVLQSLAIAPAVLLGHSVGGFAAARVAARMPGRVRGLVLVNAGGFDRLGRGARLFCSLKGRAWMTRIGEARFARFHTRVRTEAAAEMIARVDRARRDRAYDESVAAVWRSFARPGGHLDEASAIRCDTLLVWGARDPVIPVRAARAAERAIAGSRLVLLDTGHTPFVEDAPGFLAAVEPFLAARA